jgi:hypothetical protein
MLGKFLARTVGGLFVIIGVFGTIGAAVYTYDYFPTEADKERARNHAPPEAVAIQDFDGKAHVGPANEVVVLAQVLPAQIRQEPANHTRWMVPLHATNAPISAQTRPIAFLAEPKRPFVRDLLTPAIQGKGPTGVLMRINGRRTEPGHHYGALAKVTGAFDERTLVLELFLDGRDAALAPDKAQLLIGLGGLLLSLLIIAYGVHEWRKQDA